MGAGRNAQTRRRWAIQKAQDIARRDDVDKARLLDLYGVDYQDRAAFEQLIPNRTDLLDVTVKEYRERPL